MLTKYGFKFQQTPLSSLFYPPRTPGTPPTIYCLLTLLSNSIPPTHPPSNLCKKSKIQTFMYSGGIPTVRATVSRVGEGGRKSGRAPAKPGKGDFRRFKGTFMQICFLIVLSTNGCMECSSKIALLQFQLSIATMDVTSASPPPRFPQENCAFADTVHVKRHAVPIYNITVLVLDYWYLVNHILLISRDTSFTCTHAQMIVLNLLLTMTIFSISFLSANLVYFISLDDCCSYTSQFPQRQAVIIVSLNIL